MAKKKAEPKKEKKISEQEDSGFGTYAEYNGGGTPKGGVWGGKDGRVGWKKRGDTGELAEGDHREDQARTQDGKFTYNSVNGKETKYESRGETVNPLLTGGVNGIKIKDVEKQFKEKSGELYEKYKNKWYERGSEKEVRDGKKRYHTKKSNEDIWEVARRSFDIEKGEFAGESEVWESKKGRRSGEAKDAAAAARKEGADERYVTSEETGGIKKSVSAEEEAQNEEERETRRRAVDYMKGRETGGRAVRESFKKMEGGVPRVFSKEELDALIEKAKSTAAAKILRAPRRTAGTTSTAGEAPIAAEEPRKVAEDIPVGEVKADTSAETGEEKVYSYNKNNPVKSTAKHSEENVSHVRDLINEDADMTDEEKAGYTYILENGSEEDIDTIMDVFAELGLIK